jgi:excisionase family DNA binding protein
MANLLRVVRVCKHCGKDFIAQRTTTNCCSERCAKMYYKTKKKDEKIEASNKETFQIKIKPYEQLKAKEFLTVPEVSLLLNCSRPTIYRLIEQGTINALRLSKRKTIIRRIDIDSLFYPNNSAQ